jgi:hypothetical protein
MTPESDREVDELLADTAALRRRLRAESAEEVPPPHVDAAILAAARRSVNARPTLAGRSPWRRWQVPLAAAAVLVVAASLSLMIERRGEPGVPMSVEHPGSAVPAPTPADAAKTPAERADVASLESLHQDRDARATQQPVKARAQAPAREMAGGGSKDVANSSSEPARVQDAPAVQPATPSVGAAAVADARESKREQENHTVALPAPPPAKEEARPVQQELARASEEPGVTADAGGPATAARSEAQRTPVPAAARSAPAPAAGGAETRQKQLKSEEALRFSDQVPESTLLAIRKLWEEGHEQLARERLAEFLRKHPGYPLPPDFPVPRPGAEPFKERTPEGR